MGRPKFHSFFQFAAGAVIAIGLGWPTLMTQPAQANERNNAQEAVANLKAYAAYKSGDYDKAKKIWEGLAEKGNTTALINLANLFQQGQGVSEDQKEAIGYIKKAAELGDSRAQYELGIAYEKGAVVERDIQAAAKWLRKSAEQDDADGQFAYGVMLATSYGKGVKNASEQERIEALSWLNKAKSNGNTEAADYISILEKGAVTTSGEG